MAAQLNLLLIDALLKAYGAPRLSELIRKLSLLEKEVAVRIELGGNEASETMRKVLESIAELSGGKVKLVELNASDTSDYPAPHITIETGFEGRLRYHGLIDGILLCPLVESILYAGGVLEAKAPETGEHHLVLYVVPGRPCLVTLRALIPLTYVNDGLRLDVVDAREYERMGRKLPSPYVPALLVDGKLVKVGAVKTPEEAAELIG